MKSLEARLARIREGAKKSFPQEARDLMHRATQELVDSRTHERALGEGAAAPDFTLAGGEGDATSLAGLLERGPAVLTFFRGYW